MEKEPEIVEMNGASNFQKGLAVFFAIVSVFDCCGCACGSGTRRFNRCD